MSNNWLTKEQLESIISSIPIDDIQRIYFSCDSGYYVKVGVDSKGILYVLESGFMGCLCETCVHSDTNDTKDFYGITTYFCYNKVIAAGELPEFDGYYCAKTCPEYKEVHMNFKVGDKVTIVDNETTKYPVGTTGVIKDIYTDTCGELGFDVTLDDECPQFLRERHLKLIPSCTKDLECSITEESTCCFECENLESCREDGMCLCDESSCEKHEDNEGDTDDELCDSEDEPCVCPMCTLEELLADTLEEVEMLKEELLMDKQMIIELQRELLEKQKVW